MLTVEKLRKIVTEAYESDEWVCMRSGSIFTLFKSECESDIEDLLVHMEDDSTDPECEPFVVDKSDRFCYTEADRAKDWNYFKNTMAI